MLHGVLSQKMSIGFGHFTYVLFVDYVTAVRPQRSSSTLGAGCVRVLWKRYCIFIKIRPGNNFCQRKPRHVLRFLNSILAHSVGKNTFTTASSVTNFLLERQFCSSNVTNTNIRSNLIVGEGKEHMGPMRYMKE